jgi:hypothetical protein
MATTINIFDVIEEEVVLNKSQKQLQYEDLEKNAVIDKHHFNTLLELDDYAEKKVVPISNIISILLKWILQYCIPILDGNILTNPTNKDSTYSIVLQNELPILGISNIYNKNIMIPSGQQFHVVGLKLPEVFIKKYNPYMLYHFNHLEDKQLSYTGQFGLYDALSLKYTQQRDMFTHPGVPNWSGNVGSKDSMDKSNSSKVGSNSSISSNSSVSNIILFNDENTASRLLSDLVSYINFTEEYYNINFPTIGYDLFKPELDSPYTTKWNIINGTTNNNKTNAMEIKNFSPSVLKLLNEVQSSEFGKSFYFDILSTLERNKLLHLYHLAHVSGMDDEDFLSEYNDKKSILEYTLDYTSQVQEAYKQNNKIAKLNILSLNKYNSNYDKLDVKQKSVIQLEYKKLEMSEDKSTTEIRDAFNKLRDTFTDITDEELRKSITVVEKLLSKKELSDDKLLPGGVCPHTYNYALALVADFGKPWLGQNLNKLLTEQYAMPHSTAGYFCKICGEKLLDSNNDVNLLFTGDKNPGIGTADNEDDPLQNNIWKEAMYIVSTNVRFRDPIPIKPLVASIANGIRPILAIEESKLLRSKTSSQESIRDSLNLYSAIYIYAALCAIMIGNPGKMLFAREKPSDVREKEARIENMSSRSNDRPRSKDKNGGNDLSGSSEFFESDSSDNSGSNIGRSKNKSKSNHNLSNSSKSNDQSRKSNHTRSHRYVKGGKMVVTDNTKKAESFIIRNALMLLIISKELIISRLKNFSMPIVRNVFSKAYKWALDNAKPIHIDRDVARQIQQDPITFDPFYQYQHLARKLSYFSGNEKIVPGINDVLNMLGRHKDKIISDITEKDIGQYDTTTAVQPWHQKISGYTSEYQKMYDKYTYESYLSYFDFMKDKIYNKSFVPRHIQVTEHLDKYKHLLDLEVQVGLYQSKKNLRPILGIKMLNDLVFKYNNFEPEKLDLAQHFCPTGENHKIGSYIYTDGKTEITISKKDITNWLEDAFKKDKNALDKISQFAELKLINEQCSVCKKNMWDAKSSDRSSKALSNMFKSLDDILAFYQYYDTRCPLGDLHDIVDGKCSKCGRTTLSNNTDEQYYKKYSDKFHKIQLEKQNITIKSLEHIRSERDEKYAKKNIDPYIYSLKKTSELSQVSGIKYNTIINIGLTEGVKFEDIDKAKINPSKEPYNEKMRCMKLKGYILMILRDYNLFLNHENVVDLPIELLDIITAQKKLNKSTNFKSMPRLNTFIKADSIAQYNYDISNYVNFLQEYLADTILTIFNTSEEFKHIGNLLMLYFTGSIIENEKILSKANPILYKVEIAEVGSDSENGSDNEWAKGNLSASSDEFAEEKEVETYENDLDAEGYDVENANDIWEND